MDYIKETTSIIRSGIPGTNIIVHPALPGDGIGVKIATKILNRDLEVGGVEILNGICLRGLIQYRARRLLEKMNEVARLAEAHEVAAIGGSDCHRMSHLGEVSTEVLGVKKPDIENILKSINNCKTKVHGTPLSIIRYPLDKILMFQAKAVLKKIRTLTKGSGYLEEYYIECAKSLSLKEGIQ